MLGAALAAVFLYWLLRQMERWLQQHLFKVGWLLTKDFRTTTVLFYVFFLPGIVLHEVSVWLIAGVLNVRAERPTQFPAPQEIPELKLNLVRVSNRAPKWKLALIELAPPIAGVAVVALIASSVLDITPALEVMRTGDLNDVGRGFALLTDQPDFWLWTYVMFTVANTMSPKLTAREGLRPALYILLALAVFIVAVGLVEDALAAIDQTVSQIANTLAAVFGVVVALNAVAIFGLAIVENTIEYITGDSATVEKGKLVAKKRAEIIAEREQERQRQAKARAEAKARAPAATEGIPSIYRLPLPLPDSPDTTKRVIVAPPEPAVALDKPRTREPDVIEAQAEVKTSPLESPTPAPGSPRPPTGTPPQRPSTPPSAPASPRPPTGTPPQRPPITTPPSATTSSPPRPALAPPRPPSGDTLDDLRSETADEVENDEDESSGAEKFETYDEGVDEDEGDDLISFG